jgi:hypothetical protein
VGAAAAGDSPDAAAQNHVHHIGLHASGHKRGGGDPIKLTDLADVSATAPINGQVPQWSTGTSKFVMTTPASGGSGGGGSVFAYKAADAAAITNTTGLADDADLHMAVDASTKYLLTAQVMYDAGATCDMKTKFIGPSGATLDWASNGLVTGASGATGSVDRAARTIASSPGNGGGGAGTVVTVTFTGLLQVSTTAGTFKMQFAQNTLSATESVIVKAGSFLDLRPVA